jgi:hypothetical protein
MTKTTEPIRLGIDLGSTIFRAAYVHPEDEHALVTVPISIDEFRPCFPIAERLHFNEVYISRYFPSLIQRLDREFELSFGGRVRTATDLLAELVVRTVEAARNYAARDVEALVLSGPMWLSTESRAAARQAAAAAKLAHAEVCTDAQSLAAWSRAEPGLADSSETMLFFVAGYTGMGVALARSTPRGVRVLARSGHQGILAGNCLDFAIMQGTYQLLRQERIVTTEATALGPWVDLQAAAQSAKEAVAEGRDAELRFPTALAPEVGKVKLCVSAAAFTRMVETQMTEAVSLVDDILEDAGVQLPEVRHVLLFGGTTHIPTIRERLTAHFPQAKVRHLPSEAVAFGAARLARLASPDIGDTAVDAAADFYYPPLEVETGLIYMQAGAGTKPGPDAATEPGGLPNKSASQTSPDEAAPQGHAPTAEKTSPPIKEQTITGILGSAGVVAPNTLIEAIERLRELEQTAARERERLELMLKAGPTGRN